MEESKKKNQWLYAVVAALVIALVVSFIKINSLTLEIDNVRNHYASEISDLRNEVAAIYDNVDERMKKEASLLTGVDFSIGDLNEENDSVELILTVVPKTISEDMQLSVTVDGETALLTKDGNEFSGVIDVGLFVDYDNRPLLTIETADGSKNEYLEDVDIAYMFSRYLPSLYADMFSGEAEFTKDKLRVDLGFTIESKPASSNEPVTFTSFTLMEEINGKEIARKDITSDVGKAGESYDTRYIETFEVSQGDELKVYVIAEDSLGYIHKTLAHYWYENQEGATAETVFGGESIYDREGNLLYGAKQ